MYLHMFMAKDYRGVANQLPKIIIYLEQYSVADKHLTEKMQLIEYAEELSRIAFCMFEEY
jgi:hypothetical protein